MAKSTRRSVITDEYIDMNRSDASAMSELVLKLLQELSAYGVALPPTHALSTASVGKALLRSMGVEPVLTRQPNFPKEYLGYAQSAFFGGRTSVHIRKVVCPVVYLDFLSMYCTINCLMDLWRFVIAREIRVVEHCQRKVERFLRTLTPDALFKRKTWKQMTGFVKIVPNVDIQPIRSRFSVAGNDWQVGTNYVYPKTEDAMWFSIPDVVASVLLTGRIPEILDAFMIEAHGTIPTLTPTKLRGVVEVDPERDDFFRVIVEERLCISSRRDLSDVERNRLEKALKILASATSYGIWAQMDRVEGEDKIDVTCHGIDAEPFK